MARKLKHPKEKAKDAKGRKTIREQYNLGDREVKTDEHMEALLNSRTSEFYYMNDAKKLEGLKALHTLWHKECKRKDSEDTYAYIGERMGGIPWKTICNWIFRYVKHPDPEKINLKRFKKLAIKERKKLEFWVENRRPDYLKEKAAKAKAERQKIVEAARPFHRLRQRGFSRKEIASAMECEIDYVNQQLTVRVPHENRKRQTATGNSKGAPIY